MKSMIKFSLVMVSLGIALVLGVYLLHSHTRYGASSDFFVSSAQARETLAERRQRILRERAARNNPQAFDDQQLAEEHTDTVTIAANAKSKVEFSAEMESLIAIPGEKSLQEMAAEKRAAAQLKAQQEAVQQQAVGEEQASEGVSRSERRRAAIQARRQSRSTSGGAPALASGDDGEKVIKTQAMRAEVYTKLEEAQALYQEKKYDEALGILDALTNLSGRKELLSYERANVWNFYAFIYYSKELFDKAIEAYKTVLQQPDLPRAMMDKTKYTIAQLFMVKEEYAKAIQAFEDWFKSAEEPAPESYATLSQAYVQIKDYDKALYNMKRALQASKLQGRGAKEQWYEVLRYLYHEKQMPKEEQQALEILVKNWPKKKYWMGLAGMYGEQGKEAKQMQILNTLYIKGVLDKESEIVSLAQMYAANEVPFKAARIMQRGMDESKIAKTTINVERTGEYWRQAYEMEKALPILEEASKKNADGKSSERLAYIYYDLAKYVLSAEAAKRAIQKGGLRDVDGVRMLMGQALFNAQRFDEASRVFAKVSKEGADESQRALALQWIDYMEREKVRIKEIAEYLSS